MIDQRYLWDRLYRAAMRSAAMTPNQRRDLAAFIQERTADPVILDFTRRMMDGILQANEVAGRVDMGFDPAGYRERLQASRLKATAEVVLPAMRTVAERAAKGTRWQRIVSILRRLIIG